MVLVVEERLIPSGKSSGQIRPPILNSLARRRGPLNSRYPAPPGPAEFPELSLRFSGSNQGYKRNACPAGPFRTPNLGGAFRGGVEPRGLRRGPSRHRVADLPVGRLRPTAQSLGLLARVGRPAIPAGANRPFASFPTDFRQLPTVSFVVPDLRHDMHNGLVRAGDDWLKRNLGPFEALGGDEQQPPDPDLRRGGLAPWAPGGHPLRRPDGRPRTLRRADQSVPDPPTLEDLYGLTHSARKPPPRPSGASGPALRSLGSQGDSGAGLRSGPGLSYALRGRLLVPRALAVRLSPEWAKDAPTDPSMASPTRLDPHGPPGLPVPRRPLPVIPTGRRSSSATSSASPATQLPALHPPLPRLRDADGDGKIQGAAGSQPRPDRRGPQGGRRGPALLGGWGWDKQFASIVVEARRPRTAT